MASSFETLEALALFLCKCVDEFLLSRFLRPDERGWRYNVSLEKPVAVPLADAPRVQLSLDSREIHNIRG